jgi:hypothetical protein
MTLMITSGSSSAASCGDGRCLPCQQGIEQPLRCVAPISAERQSMPVVRDRTGQRCQIISAALAPLAVGGLLVGSIPGFGRNLTERLVSWREGVERRFHSEPAAANDPRDV